MLNPDGAERFQRRNALGIDINRDARALVTPEGRTLKALQERFCPAWGSTCMTRTCAPGLAAVSGQRSPCSRRPSTQPERAIPPGCGRNSLAATIRQAAEPLVGGHITRYDDTFNPRAFGDLMQSWGTSTVLIESGGWRDDPEKQYLRRVNFVMLLAALDAIATGTYARADLALYEASRERAAGERSAGAWGHRGVAGPGAYRADVAIDFRDSLGAAVAESWTSAIYATTPRETRWMPAGSSSIQVRKGR